MSHENEASGAWRLSHGADGARVPPSSVSAEQSVLGGLMLRGDSLHDVADLLTEDDFYRADHRLIFRAITELAADGKPIDAVTLAEWFEVMGLADQVAGGAYLIDLASTTPSAANIRAYSQIVADKARLRRAIEVGTNLINDAFVPEGRDSIEIIGNAQTAIGALLQSQPCELEEMRPVLNRVFANLQRRSELGGAIDGLSSGLSEWDRITNGMRGGQLIILAARPGMGKTTLALNISEHVALVQGKQAGVFSFEMSQDDQAERIISSRGGVDYSRLRSGCLEDEDWSRVANAVRDLRTAPLRLSQPHTARVEAVCAQARRLHAKSGLDFLVIDYLQLMDTKGAENRTQGITEVSRQLKMLAVDLNIPVLALSQLNRSVESRADKRPVMSDLRESGSIEQDADTIVFIYRDEQYNENSPDKGTAELIFAKQRGGKTGTVRVASRLNVCRFDDLSSEWAPMEIQRESRPRSGFGKRSSGRDYSAGAA